MTIDEITKLRVALINFDKFEAAMEKRLDELSADAEETGDYRKYDEVRFDWLEMMQGEGQYLAEVIRKVLKSYE